MEDDPENKVKMPKIAKVKNKMPAPVQITAEQLLREAKERELELVPPPPKQKISDPDELAQYKLRKRKAFEDNIRKNRSVMSNWIKYAAWEESQKEIQRARSVWERAMDVDHRNITLWLKYAEMEMKNKQINHSRNLWDRAVTIMPRANQLWYKYTYMEEMLGNIAGARQVFDRWMEWQPNEQAWHSYINFELRYKELDRARVIYEQFVIVHPDVKNWIKYARFEEKNGYISSARHIYERGIEFFGEDNMDEFMLIAFAKFEEKQKEHERARVIYKYGLDHLPKQKCEEIYKWFTVHEKKFGSRAAIEDVIVSKRRFHYEEEVKNNPNNYDAWFDYLRLLESDGDPEVVRETYERAISNLPPSQEKRHWRRYIYLWVNYALYEELVMDDMERTREVYRAALDIIPHKRFTFAKLWIMYSHFEVRQKNLAQARKIMGAAIGKCPKTKIFRVYIDLEIQLREFERCRILYEKFLEFNPGNCSTWIKYAELESILGDLDRARAVYELATNQTALDMPEVLWKSYIDFEIEAEEFDLTRELYRRLLQRTQHVKVWISFALFEKSLEEGRVERARSVYKEANSSLRSSHEKEERLMLLESWQEFEDDMGTVESREFTAKMMPQKVKKRRKIQTDDQMDAGWEEFYDYIFPDDEAAQPNLKLLAMAKRWKQNEAMKNDDDHDDDSDASDKDESRDDGVDEEGVGVDTKGNDEEMDEDSSVKLGVGVSERENVTSEPGSGDGAASQVETDPASAGEKNCGKGDAGDVSVIGVSDDCGGESGQAAVVSSGGKCKDSDNVSADERKSKVGKRQVESSSSSSSSSSTTSSDGDSSVEESTDRKSDAKRKQSDSDKRDGRVKNEQMKKVSRRESSSSSSSSESSSDDSRGKKSSKRCGKNRHSDDKTSKSSRRKVDASSDSEEDRSTRRKRKQKDTSSSEGD